MRKTKIIGTIGPASSDEQVFTAMCKAGLNVARLNFSHGTHEEQQAKLDMIRRVREKLDLPIAIMLDTKGPEFRIKTFENGKITLNDGAPFTFTTDDSVIGNQSRVAVNYAGLAKDLRKGDRILVNNGLVIFEVESIEGSEIHCKTLVGGVLSDRKSMSFPNKTLNQVYLSELDKQDLLFGIRNHVDFVAASFVSRKQDLADMRAFLEETAAGISPSSLKSRTGPAWIISKKFATSATASWWPVAIWVWKYPSRSCPPSRSTSSASAGCWASGSLPPRKCWNP